MSSAPGYPSTVRRVLTRSATRLPGKLALTFAQRRYTYAELDRAAGRVAARLLGRGLHPGDRVAAYGKNSDAYLLLYLGCARAGLVHVPVNFNARGDELVYLLTHEVEDAIYEHAAVAEVAVVGLAHERWIEAIAAVVVARDPVSPEELIAFARERLAAHKVPKSVHFVDELPKNASGKLLKRELRDQLSAPATASPS